MRVTREASAILGKSSIGMLALRSGRQLLVNPAVFAYSRGSVWMTTSRYAAKTIIARRDPRAAFLVDGGTRAVLLRGMVDVLDPLDIPSQLRTFFQGPGYALGMAEYALRNLSFFAGYALDLARLPREWWPYNRVVLRLRVADADLVQGAPFPAAHPSRVPAVPAEVSKRLAGVSRGYACWIEGGLPVLRPAFWEADRRHVSVAPTSGRARSGPGALVVESHHRFRPSQMVGACVRGTFAPSADGSAIADRYGIALAEVPQPVIDLKVERVTSWRGFQVTTSVPRSARQLRVAEGA